MAGEPNESAATTNGAGGAPEPQAAASPVAAPAAAPEVAPAPVAESAPAAAPAVADPAPAAAEPAAPAVEPTLLEKFDAEKAAKEAKPEEKPAEPEKKPEAAAGEAPKPEEKKPDAEVKAEEPAAPAPVEPVAYEYTLPETLQMDDAQRGELHTALDAFRADPAKGVQGLVDLHNKTMQAYAEDLSKQQWKTFQDTRKGWVTQVMADEQLGGAGHDTTMGAVARMRDLLVPEKNREEFNDFLKITGAGDHPAFLRILHNAARIYDEAPLPPPNIRPAPNAGMPKGRGLRGLYKSNQAQ